MFTTSSPPVRHEFHKLTMPRRMPNRSAHMIQVQLPDYISKGIGYCPINMVLLFLNFRILFKILRKIENPFFSRFFRVFFCVFFLLRFLDVFWTFFEESVLVAFFQRFFFCIFFFLSVVLDVFWTFFEESVLLAFFSVFFSNPFSDVYWGKTS